MSDAGPLAAALTQRLDNLISGSGSITFPAVPAMADIITDKCASVFGEQGRAFSAAERASLRAILVRALTEAHEFSQRSSVTITYQSRPAEPLNYSVRCNLVTIEQAYREWVASRDESLFGNEPDARVCALAAEAADPAVFPVLDVGAGTGRNALALARRGHPVDAAELTAEFAEAIRLAAERESLKIRVIRRDVFDRDCYLRRDYALIVLSGVVSEFRAPSELRALFELAARHLAAGGALLFNAFVADPVHFPGDGLDAAARQFAQHSYSAFFTRGEIAAAAGGLPLELTADDSVHDYERTHLPAGGWPPTAWYANWATGRDVFGPAAETPPIELRWLVYRKR